jgi:hypothetical protein
MRPGIRELQISGGKRQDLNSPSTTFSSILLSSVYTPQLIPPQLEREKKKG